MSIRKDGYILSRDIRVFPCSYRGDYNGEYTFDPESRLMSEEHLTGPKAFGNLKSYVISFDNNILKCVIDGYYFEINDLTASDFITDSGTKKLYIKTREVILTEDNDSTDSKRVTKVLASFDDESSTSLDIIKSGETDYIFTGLLIAESFTDSAIEFDFINSDGSIKENTYLPTMIHGIGINAIAFNDNPSSSAAGEKSVSFGDSTNVASGRCSAVFGAGTIADKDNLVAIGEYNVTSNDDLFVIGNGTDSKHRSNVLEVNTNAVNINKDTTITGNISIIGTETVTEDFSVNTDKFKVTASNGTTDIKGNLNIKKDVTSESGETTTETKVSFEADTGNASIDGNVTIGGTVNIAKDLNINTDKFTVAAKSGNTVIAGTAAITGATTIGGNLAVNTDKFTVDAATGNTTIAGTLVQSNPADKAQVTFNGNVDALDGLNVTGELTSSDKLTVSNNGADITGDTTITGDTIISGKITLNSHVELEYDSTNSCLKIKIN